MRLQIKIISMIKQKKRKLGKKLIADCRENLVLTRMNRIANTYPRTKVFNHLKFLIFLGNFSEQTRALGKWILATYLGKARKTVIFMAKLNTFRK